MIDIDSGQQRPAAEFTTPPEARDAAFAQLAVEKDALPALVSQRNGVALSVHDTFKRTHLGESD